MLFDRHYSRDHRPDCEQVVMALMVRSEDRRFHWVRPPLISSDRIAAGHVAIDVAAAMGARRIVLLGYDCRALEIDGRRRSHCHDDHAMQRSERLYADVILPTWSGWGERMRKRGVDVINASPGSALKEFPRLELADAMAA